MQERVPELPAFQPEELGALHTLRDVVNLANARIGTLRGSPEFHTALQNSQLDVVMVPVPRAMPTATSVPPQSVPTAPQAISLDTTVLAVVAEKTGYPIEMLNLDMSLDHDLGIDSIKRVEILSALQERVPQLPAFQPEELGALHTLRDVVALADARTNETKPLAHLLPQRCLHPSVRAIPR